MESISLSTKAVLVSRTFLYLTLKYYIIFQRMNELNQQLMIRKYNLIITQDEENLSPDKCKDENEFIKKHYDEYFKIIETQFHKYSSKYIESPTDSMWNGIFETIDNEALVVVLWKLITANFTIILYVSIMDD